MNVEQLTNLRIRPIRTSKRSNVQTGQRSNARIFHPLLILQKEIQKNEGGTNVKPPFSPLFCRKWRAASTKTAQLNEDCIELIQNNSAGD